MPNILGVENKDYGECAYCKNGISENAEILVPWEIYSEWLWIMQKMGSKEFGGVYDVKDGKVSNPRYPLQEVGTAHATFKEDLGGNGVVHSHHSMGAFHSSQDDAEFRNMAEYSLVLSFSGVIGSRRVVLPCGGFGHVPLKILIEGVKDVDVPVYETPAVIKGFGGEYPDWKKNHAYELWKKEQEEKEDRLSGMKIFECQDCGHTSFLMMWDRCEKCGSEAVCYVSDYYGTWEEGF